MIMDQLQGPVDLLDDIVLLVLEYLLCAPEVSKKRQCEVLGLARHVRRALEPLLYRYIYARTKESSGLILSVLKTRNYNVQNLLIFPAASSDFLPLVTACRETITTLNADFLQIFHSEDLQDFLNLSFPRLDSLTLNVVFGRPDLCQPLLERRVFDKVSHLQLTLDSGAIADLDSGVLLQGLHSLSNLTHLYLEVSGIRYDNIQDHQDALVEQFPENLRVAVVSVDRLDGSQEPPKWDERLVFMAKWDSVPPELERRGLAFHAQPMWGRGHSSTGELVLKTETGERTDVWSLAEKTLARRRLGALS